MRKTDRSMPQDLKSIYMKFEADTKRSVHVATPSSTISKFCDLRNAQKQTYANKTEPIALPRHLALRAHLFDIASLAALARNKATLESQMTTKQLTEKCLCILSRANHCPRMTGWKAPRVSRLRHECGYNVET